VQRRLGAQQREITGKRKLGKNERGLGLKLPTSVKVELKGDELKVCVNQYFLQEIED
jgi:hypothetical protein